MYHGLLKLTMALKPGQSLLYKTRGMCTFLRVILSFFETFPTHCSVPYRPQPFLKLISGFGRLRTITNNFGLNGDGDSFKNEKKKHCT